MGRHQSGHIFESASGAFHVRYYTTEIVDGQPKRVQRSHLLCHKDDKHYSTKCMAVKLLREEFMRRVHVSQANEQDVRIADVCAQWYLPFVEKNMEASPPREHIQICNLHIKPLFAQTT